MDIKSVLVLDYVGTKCTEILTKHGFQVTKKTSITEIELMEIIDNYDALVVQSVTKVTMNVIRFALNLKVIVSANAYYNNIDVFAAMAKRIGVINSPHSSVISATEFSCGLLMMLARNLMSATATFRAGIYEHNTFSGNELYRSTLALIGIGDVAKEVAYRMNRFGMRIIGYDDSMSVMECQSYFIRKMNLCKIWPLADYIIIFLTPFSKTRIYITAEILSRCKRGVKVIVMGHIGPYQSREMYNALLAGYIGTAAFDMYDATCDREIFKVAMYQHPAVVITRNLATQTEESIENGGREAAEQLVNLCKPGTYTTPLSIVFRVDGM
ncbi:PREDICTED: D-3-phosphoglycerate dehydrogenase-like [Papilio xuthus]|uniref:D-3-phosphoglycerate dehydrogenase-like n=1 Tax=Papilio xuthus TaxID=66420 RepID=A0AAJ7EIU8_PAPXU|nr:PREDICTED: D-3-phosphoglycerate dehydrogenase-like [Papilio xuthus]